MFLASPAALRVRRARRPALRLEGADQEERDMRRPDMRGVQHLAGTGQGPLPHTR